MFREGAKYRGSYDPQHRTQQYPRIWDKDFNKARRIRRNPQKGSIKTQFWSSRQMKMRITRRKCSCRNQRPRTLREGMQRRRQSDPSAVPSWRWFPTLLATRPCYCRLHARPRHSKFMFSAALAIPCRNFNIRMEGKVKTSKKTRKRWKRNHNCLW